MKYVFIMPLAKSATIFEYKKKIESFLDCVVALDSDEYKSGRVVSIEDLSKIIEDGDGFLIINPCVDFRDEWLNYESMDYMQLPKELLNFYSWKMTE